MNISYWGSKKSFSPIDSLLLLGMRVRVGQFTKAMARLHHTDYL